MRCSRWLLLLGNLTARDDFKRFGSINLMSAYAESEEAISCSAYRDSAVGISDASFTVVDGA
jgi:hypothetical protein